MKRTKHSLFIYLFQKFGNVWLSLGRVIVHGSVKNLSDFYLMCAEESGASVPVFRLPRHLNVGLACRSVFPCPSAHAT